MYERIVLEIPSGKCLRSEGSRHTKAIILSLLTGFICIASVAVHARQSVSQPQYDLLITGGHIIDGSGSPWFEGSVAVKNGKIVDIGRLVKADARRVIDATGLVVTPGFIDLHCHSDFPLLVNGTAQSMIRQGVYPLPPKPIQKFLKSENIPAVL